MRVFGLNISVSKATTPAQPTTPLFGDRGNWWWPVIREPFGGAWQRNETLKVESVVTYFAVYSCLSLISTDIGKLGLRLMRETDNGLLVETTSAAFSPVLRKPNHYQTRGKFIETWMLSKLIHGNTYVLKERDARGVVVALYVLEPTRAKVLVAPDGAVFYEFAADNLSGTPLPIAVPASEIIHDVNSPLFHPLCGISPILAASLPIIQGLSIQKHSAKFFEQGARPGGVLSAPGTVPQARLDAMKNEWETRFTGENAGRIAVLTDGLKFEGMGMPADQAQLIEQLKWSAENVASVFHVPPFMIGIGAAPSFDNVEALNQQYYSQCLQTHIEFDRVIARRGTRASRHARGLRNAIRPRRPLAHGFKDEDSNDRRFGESRISVAERSAGEVQSASGQGRQNALLATAKLAARCPGRTAAARRNAAATDAAARSECAAARCNCAERLDSRCRQSP